MGDLWGRTDALRSCQVKNRNNSVSQGSRLSLRGQMLRRINQQKPKNGEIRELEKVLKKKIPHEWNEAARGKGGCQGSPLWVKRMAWKGA